MISEVFRTCEDKHRGLHLFVLTKNSTYYVTHRIYINNLRVAYFKRARSLSSSVVPKPQQNRCGAIAMCVYAHGHACVIGMV